jgi:integrase
MTTRGSIQLRHRKGCPAKGKDGRRCSCSPTVYAVFGGEWSKIGYLCEGWRKGDLGEFDSQLAEMRRKRDAGEPYRPGKPKRLREWAAEWFAGLYDAAEAGDISKLTYNTYEGDFRNHIEPYFGDKPLGAISSDMVRRYIRSKVAGGLSPRTANATITPLSAMLTDAIDEGLIQSNPCHRPRRARHGASRRRALLAEVKAEKPKHLEPTEAQALLAATPDEYRDLILAALSTGFRRGELLGLRWEDIRWADARIDLRRQLQRREPVPPKYRSYREVVLYSGLRDALAKRRQAEGYVFLSPSCEPWGDVEPDTTFLRDAYARAGLTRPGVLWHALRHTYASTLAAGGIREDVVAVLMGHKRAGTTSIYTHLFADAFEGVEEALDRVLRVNEASMDCSVSTEHDGNPPDSGSIANGGAEPVLAR